MVAIPRLDLKARQSGKRGVHAVIPVMHLGMARRCVYQAGEAGDGRVLEGMPR